MNKQEIIEKLESVMSDIDTVLYFLQGKSENIEDITQSDRHERDFLRWIKFIQRDFETV